MIRLCYYLFWILGAVQALLAMPLPGRKVLDPRLEGRPAWRFFTDREGLPQSSVHAMALDAEGFLWAGTEAGAARYDGTQWRSQPLPAGAPSIQVWAFLQASDGSFWCASRPGLYRRNRDRWEARESPPGGIACLVEGPSTSGTTVYVGTDAGVFRLEGDTWREVAHFRGLQTRSDVRVFHLQQRKGRSPVLWVGTRGGLAFCEQGRWAWVDDPLIKDRPIEALAETRTEGEPALWAGGSEGLFRWDGKTWAAGAPNRVPVVALLPGPEPEGSQSLWIGVSGKGLHRRDVGGIRPVQGLPSPVVLGLFETISSGGIRSLWVATHRGGLARGEPDRISIWDAAFGFPANQVTSVIEGQSPEGAATIYAGTLKGLVRWERGSWEPLPPLPGLVESSVSSMAAARAEDGSQSLWVGFYGGGLASFAGGRWKLFHPPTGFPEPLVTALLPRRGKDGEPETWVGTERELFTGNGKDWKPFFPPCPGIAQGVLLETAAPPMVWAGTRMGLARFDGQSWKLYGPADGFPVGMVGALSELLEGGASYLWAGSTAGAVRMDLRQGKLLHLNKESNPPLPDNVVRAVLMDRAGRTWIFTNRGIARLTPRRPTPEDYAEYSAETLTSADGLPSQEFTGGTYQVDGQGRLWAGTAAGLVRLDPRAEGNPVAKPLHLRGSSVGEAPAELAAGMRLKHRQNFLRFEYAFLDFFKEAEVCYRVQLEGYEPLPSDWDTATRKEYAKVPPGTYTFRVWARSGVQVQSIALPFQVSPAPWQTLWAFGLYLLAGLAGLVGLVKARTRTLRLRSERLEAQVRDRTSELQLATSRLLEAQAQVARLTGSSPEESEDIPRWAKTTAQELARVLGALRIGIWRVHEGSLSALSDGEGTEPGLETLQDPSREFWTVGERISLPIRGQGRILLGIITIDGPDVAWGEPEQHLMRLFATQLANTLELGTLRQRLEAAESRQSISLKSLQERGIDTLRLCPRCGRCYSHEQARCDLDGVALEVPLILPRTPLGRYRLERLLGEGATGLVFEAQDQKLHRLVALKLLRPEYLKIASCRQRFELEAKAIAQIRHPGVITLHDSGELEDGTGCLVMERLYGASVGDLLARFGPGTPAQVAHLLRLGAAGLGAAHRAALIHRDLKPQNIFITQEGDPFGVKILDFGLVKSERFDAGQTQTGMILGTPRYMAPEQLEGLDVDARSDLYSFAAVAYEALVGRPAIQGSEAGWVMIAVLSEVPPLVSALLPGAPPEVDAAFSQALAKDRGIFDVEAWVEAFAGRLEAMPGAHPGWPSPIPDLSLKRMR